jgi:hypothetical protein
MKHKTKLLADRFTTVLSQWPGVECITLNETAHGDTLGPYFALILDVYCGEDIPPSEERRALYGEDATMFETSNRETNRDIKDRFLMGSLPVRVEYKSITRIEELVSFADRKQECLWLIKDAGTYTYYRLSEGELLFNRTGWITGIRERLAHPGDGFWQRLRAIHQSKMEHLLNDLGASFFQGDDFNYLVSSALFIKSACLTLFCINQRFEPSHRSYYKQVLDLPVLPASFAAQIETFLRPDPEMTRERKYSLAKLIARGVVTL